MTTANVIPLHGRPRYEREGQAGDPAWAQWANGIEQNLKLSGPRWFEVADEMERTDPFMRSLCQAWIHTLMSERWRWGPQPDYARHPEAIKNARRANELWAHMSVPWERQLQYLVRHSLTGVRVGEPMWRPVRLQSTGKWAVALDRVADCRPSSYARWLFEADGETVAGLEQFGQSLRFGRPGQAGNRYLPADKMLLLVSGQQGADPNGDGGLLRACYFAWLSKRHLQDVRGIGADRFGVPAVDVEYDWRVLTEQAGMSSPEAREAIDAAYESAKSWTAHGRGALKRSVGIRFAFLGNEFRPEGLNASIEQANREMTVGFLLDWLVKGADQSSSYAFAEVAETFFRRHAVNANDEIANQMSGPARAGGGVIGRLFDWNWPGTPPELLPRLEHRGLAPRTLTRFLNALPGMRQSGFVTPTNDIERAWREEAGLDFPPEADRTPEERMRAYAYGGLQEPTPQPGPGRPRDSEQPEGAE